MCVMCRSPTHYIRLSGGGLQPQRGNVVVEMHQCCFDLPEK